MSGKVKGFLISAILIVMALLMLPIVIDGVHGALTDRITDAFPGCVVAGGATDIVLTEDLYNDDTTWVSTLTATGAGAVPVAGVYTPGTNSLNVTGLGADTPQDLTATYDYGVAGDYAGLDPVTGLIPLLVVVGIILVAIINGIWALKQ